MSAKHPGREYGSRGRVGLAVPQANPAVSLAASLGVTFPFNIIAGIPLYHWMASRLAGATP